MQLSPLQSTAVYPHKTPFPLKSCRAVEVGLESYNSLMTQTNIKEPDQSNMSVFGTIPEDEFVLYGTVRIELSRIDEALQIFRDVTDIARRNQGILYFCLAQDDIEPSVFHTHERYTGRKAFEEHQKNERVVEFFNSGMVIEAKPKLLKPIG